MKAISPPNPQWKPGDRVNSPVAEMVSLDPVTLDTAAIYKLLIGCIVPRPIAFVTTVNENGTINAAPFSFFNGVSSNPPALMFSIGFRPDGEKKDTLRNIELTKDFVVNTVGEWMTEPMNYASAEYPYGVSEVEAVGLTTVASKVVAPPRIKESPVHFECRLHSLLQVGRQEAGASTVVVGEIVHFHIHRPAWRDGRIDAEQLKPVARLGGLQYSCMDSVFELPRPRLKPTEA
jgi:flavin reductase (DIM6/NTAB) family NADH-FMN oxidoreductase RutF